MDCPAHRFRRGESPTELSFHTKSACEWTDLLFEHLHRSYELSQGALRLLLAYYLGCRPHDVVFTLGPRGKPALRDYLRIWFNMAHSGGLTIHAFTYDCKVGVDLEENAVFRN